MSDTSKADGAKYVVVGQGEAPEMFVDGLSGMLLGYPLSRLSLHRTIEASDGTKPEVRKEALSLVLPTSVMIEMAQIILNAGSASKEELFGTHKEHGTQLREMLDRFNVTSKAPEK